MVGFEGNDHEKMEWWKSIWPQFEFDGNMIESNDCQAMKIWKIGLIWDSNCEHED